MVCKCILLLPFQSTATRLRRSLLYDIMAKKGNKGLIPDELKEQIDLSSGSE